MVEQSQDAILRKNGGIAEELLQFQLPVVIAAMVAVFALLEFGFYRDQMAALESSVDSLLQLQTAPASNALWEVDEEQLQRVVDSLAHSPNVESAIVTDTRGKVRAQAGRVDAPLESPKLLGVGKLAHEGVPLGELRITLHTRGVTGQLHDHLPKNVAVLAVALTAVILGVALASRRVIKRPLALLSTGIAQARERALPEPIPWSSDDELGDVVAAFNDLQATRAAAEAEVERVHTNLQRLVAERTADLSVAKEAAEAANRAKSTFLANMSHELRTPMNAIMGMTSLAMRRASDAQQKEQLDKVLKASHHLLAVINDILDISKIEAERLTLECTNFKLAEVLSDLMNLISQNARDKGLNLRLTQPAGLSATPFMGDPVRLGQILLNLASNAIKFTPAGTVTLRCHIAEDNADNLLLRWEMQDTGIGIPAESLPRLFTAFEQADGSTTRNYGGTGLGLAISKRLVELMGGQIGVVSEPGQGSTFWFTVRLKKAAAEVAVPPQETADYSSAGEALLNAHAGARILLAEDEPINQEVSRELLSEAGLWVDIANDGKEAVALARKFNYDLILMDMQMPHLNGVDASREIRQDSLNPATPILAMTANTFEEDRRACFAAGMNDFIAKPVAPEELYETLLRWLGERHSSNS